MPSVESVGGESVVMPQLEVDINLADDDADDRVVANGRELQAAYDMAAEANATVQLPAGRINASGAALASVGKPIINLDERHAGITIRGAGRAATVLVDPYANDVTSLPITIKSRRISGIYQSPSYPDKYPADTATVTVPLADIDRFQPGDVLYFWFYSLSRNDQSPSQRCRITAVNPSTGVVTFEEELEAYMWNVFRHMKGHEATDDALAAGGVQVALADGAFTSEFHVNDDIYITGGPAINETYGEWVTITGFHPTIATIIYFSPPLRQAYAAESVSVLPPPHMTDITLRDLSVAAPINNEVRYMGSVTVGRRICFENVAFVPDGDDFVQVAYGVLDVATCGDVSFRHCLLFGLSFSVTHDGILDDITARGFGFSEFCFDFECSRITFNGGNFICQDKLGFGPCQRIHLRDSLALSYCVDSGDPGMRFAEGSRISNVRLTNAKNAAEIFLNDDNLVLDGVRFDKEVWIIGENVRVGPVSAPRFRLFASDDPPRDSSGVLVGPVDTPELVDDNLAGKWLQPLMVSNDGSAQPWQSLEETTLRKPGLKLPSAGTMTVPLTIIGAGIQSANLTEWKTSGGTIVIKIDASGALVVGARATIAPSGDAVFSPPTASDKGLIVKGLSSQSGNLQEWQNSSGVVLTSIDKNGYFMTKKTSAPADGDLQSSQLALWLDDTNGAGKLMIKAKTANGTVVSGSVALT